MTASAPTRQQAATAREKLIVALDFATIREAEAFVAKLGDSVNFYKIGLELAYAQQAHRLRFSHQFRRY
jgi:orotidine-5'-phosphate decarboxylase